MSTAGRSFIARHAFLPLNLQSTVASSCFHVWTEPPSIISKLRDRAKLSPKHIVLPEGTDPRVIEAAATVCDSMFSASFKLTDFELTFSFESRQCHSPWRRIKNIGRLKLKK